MKIVIAIILVVLVTVAIFAMFQRGTSASELTQNEAKIRDLVREVYGSNITAERIVRDGSDAVLEIALQDEKLKQLQVNLSSLARKHEEGASLPALKESLRFE